ncbi:hypothetical protein PproGo58_03630 [Pseudomonas protegens]|nr:hypothetical protein PproGo58_03630 [Pseudomonas protegens]
MGALAVGSAAWVVRGMMHSRLSSGARSERNRGKRREIMGILIRPSGGWAPWRALRWQASSYANRLLYRLCENYCVWQYCVKNRLGMLI